MDLRCRLSTEKQAKENGDSAKVKKWNEKGGRVAKENPEHVGRAARQDTLRAAWCRKRGNKFLYAIDEDDGENAEESTENEEDLQAWCLLEESENEWQEVISKQNKKKVKKANQASLLSVENSRN